MAPGGGLWGTEEPENLPSGPGRPNYANHARVSTNFETPADLEKGPHADSMHRAEGSGVRPHAEVAKVLCIAAKLRTPAIQRSRNPLSPYRVVLVLHVSHLCRPPPLFASNKEDTA